MELYTVFQIILSLVVQILANESRICFKRFCHCSRNKLKTTCFSLSFIPHIPDYSRTLEITRNVFPVIDKHIFRNVSMLENLKSVIIKNNSVTNISGDAFQSLHNLRKLEISYEKKIDLSSLQTSFKSLNSSTVEELHFENNGWNELPDNFFEHLKNANISKVSLNYNNFVTLNTTIFSPFYRLRKLYCVSNHIVFVDAAGLKTVEHLDLTGNNIFTIPNFCSNEKSLAPRLRVLTLIDNALRVFTATSFQCLDNLKELLLDSNRLTSLQNDAFSILRNLRRLTINRTPQLKYLRSRAFNSISLEKIQFVQNGFRFDKSDRFDAESIFQFSPSLNSLDLSTNYLPDSGPVLRNMFSPLKSLKTLNLHSTSLNTVPDNVLQHLPLLEKLVLNGNKIERWSHLAFENVTSLKILYLGENNIHVINRTSFPQNMLISLEKLDLSNNPYWCICEQKWFVDMLRSTNLTIKLFNWPIRYTCSYPEKLKRLWLLKYKPTIDDCTPYDPMATIVALILSAVLIIIVLVILSMKCQTNIRNAMYLLRLYKNKKSGVVKIESSQNFEFDAFVVYCDADRHWVHNVLLKCLENVGLKVCIHHRDFEIGETITTNIEKFMEKSWKIIVIMSNNFAKSEWCQWEVCLVQERRRQKGKDALVLIMRQQIDSRHMTSPIRTLLYTTPYLTYKGGLGEDLFWKAVIKSARKSYSHPPAAVL